jgi:peptidoglycan/LPS O-acetylase OafA/YrhL
MTVSPTRHGRNRRLDLFRIVFATMVLLAHAPELTDGNRSREIFNRLTGSGMSFGEVGVMGFFLLSGYLIVQSWQGDPEFLNYLRKRVLRIVPGFLVAALLSTVVVGLLAPGIPDFFRHFNKDFIFSVLLLGSPKTPPVFPGLPDADVNRSMWTIAYEFRNYILAGIFGACGLLRRSSIWVGVTVLLLVIAAIPALEHLLEWHRLVRYIGHPEDFYRLTAMFFVGGCFHLLRDRIVFRPVFAMAAAAGLLLVIIFNPGILEITLTLLGGYLLFYLAQVPLNFLPTMNRFPDISYGIYLYGWPVESLWIWYRHGSPWITFLASTVICFALGWLSWHFVERPMLKLKRKATAPLPAP